MKGKTSSTKKFGIISSRGGHLFQLYQLKPWWVKYDRFWATLPGDDVTSMLSGEKVYFGFAPESRNIINAFRNTLLAVKILLKERPTHLISCGAGIAPPFFYVGKLLGIKLIFIEPYDFISYSSLSGKLVSPIVDAYLVQHKGQKKFFNKAIYRGAIL